MWHSIFYETHIRWPHRYSTTSGLSYWQKLWKVPKQSNSGTVGSCWHYKPNLWSSSYDSHNIHFIQCFHLEAHINRRTLAAFIYDESRKNYSSDGAFGVINFRALFGVDYCKSGQENQLIVSVGIVESNTIPDCESCDLLSASESFLKDMGKWITRIHRKVIISAKTNTSNPFI